MNRNILIVLVLVILVVLTVVQTIQLASLKSQVSSGKVAVASGGGASGGNVPSSVNELPSMVGGC